MKGTSVARSESPSHIEASGHRHIGAIPHDEDGLLPHESEFLAELGNRVREMRALRGMSRRELARRAGLSERYVAQIEVGKGNVSIVRLLRIALAFRCNSKTSFRPNAQHPYQAGCFRVRLSAMTAAITKALPMRARGPGIS
jgi:DNA-binding XRE family transcriptional regulator